MHVLRDIMRGREELVAELIGELGIRRFPERGFVFWAHIHEAPSARLWNLFKMEDVI